MSEKLCDQKCIHYGTQHPCIFCTRSPEMEDHYAVGDPSNERLDDVFEADDIFKKDKK